EHLEALRRALIVSLIAWTVTTLVSLIFASRIFELLLNRGHIHTAYFGSPTGFFMLMLKIALYLGFVLAFPVIVQQTWWFVSPGLHAHEKRVILPVIAGSVVFFLVGDHGQDDALRSEEHTSELQSQSNLVCRLLLEKKKKEIRSLPVSLAAFC